MLSEGYLKIKNKIDEDAEHICQRLTVKGEITLRDLKKELNLTTEGLNRALGWLARENLILLIEKNNTAYLSLRM